MDYSALLTTAFGSAHFTTRLTPDELDRLRGIYQEELVTMWSLAGLAEYTEGQFCLLNPEQVAPALEEWPGLPPGCTPFARDGFGNLFLIADGEVHRLDIHKNVLDLVALTVGFFFDMKIFNPSFAVDYLGRDLHARIRTRLGTPGPGEIFAFVPALALGGKKSAKSARKVSFLDHLCFLGQLHA